MIPLIRKRHDGPAWVVVTELPNSTGTNKRGAADAVAIGLWPSRGYEIHGYECKASRGDVQKELNDPSKADHIGKFCDYWWLVVEDLKIIDGLVIPENWGILVPKQNVLRVHRKAPKREATPVNRGFAAALIRKVTESWVPKSDYDALREKQRAQLIAELERDRAYAKENAEIEVKRLKSAIEAFEEASGIQLHAYQAGRIGEAVRTVLDLRNSLGREAIETQARNLERSSEQLEWQASNARRGAAAIRELLGATEQKELPFAQPPQICDLHGKPL